jgi:hypothetical protein
MTSNMTLIDTNDRWLLKLPSALPIVSFIPFARALEDRLSRRTPILPIAYGDWLFLGTGRALLSK